MDIDYLLKIKDKFSKVLTVEEGTIIGGFGDGVASWLLENGFNGKMKKIGLPDNFVEHGSRDQILSMLKLDVDGLASQIYDFIRFKDKIST